MCCVKWVTFGKDTSKHNQALMSEKDQIALKAEISPSTLCVTRVFDCIYMRTRFLYTETLQLSKSIMKARRQKLEEKNLLKLEIRCIF